MRMTDAEFEAQKQRVQAVADKWLKRLGLKWWTIKLEYSDQVLPGTAADTVCTFSCVTSWEYLMATITCGLPLIAGLSDEEMELQFVHECMHVHTAELEPADQMRAERVCTALAKAFLWVDKFARADAELVKAE